MLAAQMAIDDFTAQAKPAFNVKLVSGDMQLKPDVGANIARTWFDREGVDMIVDLPSSAVTLAVMNLCSREESRGHPHRTRLAAHHQ
ncbi:ABC transporter substrate-binding protein [Cupriavidus basilensis]